MNTVEASSRNFSSPTSREQTNFQNNKNPNLFDNQTYQLISAYKNIGDSKDTQKINIACKQISNLLNVWTQNYGYLEKALGKKQTDIRIIQLKNLLNNFQRNPLDLAYSPRNRQPEIIDFGSPSACAWASKCQTFLTSHLKGINISNDGLNGPVKQGLAIMKEFFALENKTNQNLSKWIMKLNSKIKELKQVNDICSIINDCKKDFKKIEKERTDCAEDKLEINISKIEKYKNLIINNFSKADDFPLYASLLKQELSTLQKKSIELEKDYKNSLFKEKLAMMGNIVHGKLAKAGVGLVLAGLILPANLNGDSNNSNTSDNVRNPVPIVQNIEPTSGNVQKFAFSKDPSFDLQPASRQTVDKKDANFDYDVKVGNTGGITQGMSDSFCNFAFKKLREQGWKDADIFEKIINPSFGLIKEKWIRQDIYNLLVKLGKIDQNQIKELGAKTNILVKKGENINYTKDTYFHYLAKAQLSAAYGNDVVKDIVVKKSIFDTASSLLSLRSHNSSFEKEEDIKAFLITADGKQALKKSAGYNKIANRFSLNLANLEKSYLEYKNGNSKNITKEAIPVAGRIPLEEEKSKYTKKLDEKPEIIKTKDAESPIIASEKNEIVSSEGEFHIIDKKEGIKDNSAKVFEREPVIFDVPSEYKSQYDNIQDYVNEEEQFAFTDELQFNKDNFSSKDINIFLVEWWLLDNSNHQHEAKIKELFYNKSPNPNYSRWLEQFITTCQNKDDKSLITVSRTKLDDIINLFVGNIIKPVISTEIAPQKQIEGFDALDKDFKHNISVSNNEPDPSAVQEKKRGFFGKLFGLGKKDKQEEQKEQSQQNAIIVIPEKVDPAIYLRAVLKLEFPKECKIQADLAKLKQSNPTAFTRFMNAKYQFEKAMNSVNEGNKEINILLNEYIGIKKSEDITSNYNTLLNLNKKELKGSSEQPQKIPNIKPDKLNTTNADINRIYSFVRNSLGKDVLSKLDRIEIEKSNGNDNMEIIFHTKNNNGQRIYGYGHGLTLEEAMKNLTTNLALAFNLNSPPVSTDEKSIEKFTQNINHKAQGKEIEPEKIDIQYAGKKKLSLYLTGPLTTRYNEILKKNPNISGVISVSIILEKGEEHADISRIDVAGNLGEHGSSLRKLVENILMKNNNFRNLTIENKDSWPSDKKELTITDNYILEPNEYY